MFPHRLHNCPRSRTPRLSLHLRIILERKPLIYNRQSHPPRLVHLEENMVVHRIVGRIVLPTDLREWDIEHPSSVLYTAKA